MIFRFKMPILMGGAMGAMLMLMLHGVITGEADLSAFAVIAFVAAHLLILALALAILFLGARRFPRLAHRIKAMHRPSLRQFALMLCFAILSALIIHLIHGGP